jgi:hypothetical protein
MKDRPKRVMSRMCHRHERPAKECPMCEELIPCEEHLDQNRNFKTIVPVYRKIWKQTNKYNRPTEEAV